MWLHDNRVQFGKDYQLACAHGVGGATRVWVGLHERALLMNVILLCL